MSLLREGGEKFKRAYKPYLMLVNDMVDDLGFKRVWEKRARTKSAEEVVFGPFLARRYSMSLDVKIFGFVENLLEISRGDLVLDIGCGPLARAEVYFAPKGLEIVGVDVSIAALLKARENTLKHNANQVVHFVLADTEFLPFREGSFDKILTIGLLSHLPNKLSVLNSLRDMQHCLKSNGVCYLNWLQNLYSFFGTFIALTNKILYLREKEKVQILTFKGLKEIKWLLQRADFKISKVIYGSIIMYAYYALPAFVKKKIEKLFLIMDEIRDRHPRKAFLPYSFDLIVMKN